MAGREFESGKYDGAIPTLEDLEAANETVRYLGRDDFDQCLVL
jgi:hypothetical protein